MTVLELLTGAQKIALEDATSKITVDLLKNLEYGEEIELNEFYSIYHYIEDEVIVVVLTEEWEEVFQVLYGEESGEIVFEAL